MNMNDLCRNKLFQATLALGLIGSAQQAAAQATADCQFAALECGVGSVGMNLVCAAAAAQLGLNVAFDYGCPLTAAGAYAACSVMQSTCNKSTTTRNPASSPVGFRGSKSNRTLQTITCGNVSSTSPFHNRVTGISFKRGSFSAGTLISAIRMQCSSGTGIFVNNNGNDGSTWTSGNCSNGNLVQGLAVRSGSYIDALARVCDKISYSSNDSDNTTPATYGGTGGTLSTVKCPENKYVWGLNVWYNGSEPTLSKRFVTGIELICRGYT